MNIAKPQQDARSLPKKACALGGLLVRDYRWFLSLRAKILLLIFVIAAVLVVATNVYPFLAMTHRVESNVLVMEGWVHPYAARITAEEFKKGGYQRLFTTGGPEVGRGGYINDFQTSASVGRDLLIKEGIPTELVQMVPCHVIGRDRTYSSAVALKDWFRKHDLRVRSFNIITEGAHARRTRLLFERALGRDVNVGVISVPSPDFDARHWWYYSEGLEDVIQEGLGYLYAKFFFYSRERDAAARTKPAANVRG